MAVDASETEHDPSEVVGAVDSAGGVESYVIADITGEEAWVSIHADDARSLRDWR
jgi:hypothetical protein